MLGKKSMPILLIILVSVLIFNLVPLDSHAATFQSNWLEEDSSPPVIDGSYTANEWSEAYNNTFFLIELGNPSNTRILTIFALNDDNDLYICALWSDSTYDIMGDRIRILFDEDNDGNWSGPGIKTENGVLCLLVNGGPIFAWDDCYCTPNLMMPTHADEGTQDGAAAGSYSSSQYKVEIKIPLNCTDMEDLQSKAGDLIGIAFWVQDLKVSDNYEYPNETSVNHLSAPFQLASSASTSIGTPIIFFSYLIGITSAVLLNHWRTTRRDTLFN
ncbi:MAG TPA: hypothetical protein VMV49_02035 [Candidatus Deferrimicrobium sp.]|nr:hypothetical protein [Candidatus Deferrimicrobium sp.]